MGSTLYEIDITLDLCCRAAAAAVLEKTTSSSSLIIMELLKIKTDWAATLNFFNVVLCEKKNPKIYLR